MNEEPVIVACHEPLATRLVAALREDGLEVIQLDPDAVAPGGLDPLSPRALVWEAGSPDCSDRLQAFWEGREMDEHLPILLVLPPGIRPRIDPLLDEPLDRVSLPAEPGEVVARVRGLLQMRLVRVFRRAFHDLSQPLTIARAYTGKALALVEPQHAGHAPLLELEHQVERMFRVVENLQRKRAGE